MTTLAVQDCRSTAVGLTTKYSRGIAVVVPQQAAEVFAAGDRAFPPADFLAWLDDLILPALMIAFPVKMKKGTR